MTDSEKLETLRKFHKAISNQEELECDIKEIINKNYWELLDGKKEYKCKSEGK